MNTPATGQTPEQQIDLLLQRTLGSPQPVATRHDHHLARILATRDLSGHPRRSAGSSDAAAERVALPRSAAEAIGAPRRRAWLGIAGAGLAFAVVAALLVLLFGSADSEPATTGGTVEGVERLFIVDATGVSAVDPVTGDAMFAIPTTDGPDAAVSPDGSRLYVASVGKSSIAAFDATTGRELWRTSMPDRVNYILSIGPSTLAVSPNGELLFVHIGREIVYTIAILDTTTGAIVGETSELPTRTDPAGIAIESWCAAMMVASPDGRTLYAGCSASGAIEVFDLETMARLDDPLRVTGNRIVGMVASNDETHLYVVSDHFRGLWVSVIDTDARSLLGEYQLVDGDHASRLGKQVALSDDGSLLYIATGIGKDQNGYDIASEIAVFDTRTWQEVRRVPSNAPISGLNLAAADDRSVYFASRSMGAPHDSFGNIVHRLDTITGEITVVHRTGVNEIIRILAARVPVGSPEVKRQSGVVSAITGDGLALIDMSAGGVDVRHSSTLSLGSQSPFVLTDAVHGRLIVADFVSRDTQPGFGIAIYDLDCGAMLREVPVPTLIRYMGRGEGVALSPDGSRLYVYQYEVPAGQSGNQARYWIEALDINSGEWVSPEIELPACSVVSALRAAGDRLYVACNERRGVEVIDTTFWTVLTDEAQKIHDRRSELNAGAPVVAMATGQGLLYLLTDDGAILALTPETREVKLVLPTSATAPVRFGPLMVSQDGSQFAVASGRLTRNSVRLSTAIDIFNHRGGALVRSVSTSEPFRELAIASDFSEAFVTFVAEDGVTNRLVRVDLTTGAETTVYDGWVAFPSALR